jgi:hypothetical protein
MAHDPALAHQSRGRPLTKAEMAFAQALEAVFSTGTHEFSAVAAALEAKKVARPSGTAGPWTLATLEAELVALNRDLDQAYLEHGLGPR